MINSIIELKGSYKNESGICKLATLIQSKSSTGNCFCVLAPNIKNRYKLIKKEAKTTPLPITPIRVLPNVFLPRPLITKPKSGSNGTNQSKLFIILILYNYHLRRFNTLISIDCVFL